MMTSLNPTGFFGAMLAVAAVAAAAAVMAQAFYSAYAWHRLRWVAIRR